MFTFGPVPSRRLGRSLGISIVPPGFCTYSCVYCQCGRTKNLTDHRASFYDREQVLLELKTKLENCEADFLTFVGDCEPSLSLDIGWLIQQCKKISTIPVAVITNGSLLSVPEVRESLAGADVVMPSLDAGSDEVFRKINRPHGRIDFTTMCNGIIDFKKQFSNELWLEVMLVHQLNDSKSSLNEIHSIANRIQPDQLYISTPLRPPAESWVQPSPPENLIMAQEILGQSRVISDPENSEFGLSGFSNAKEAILEISSRHPLRLEQAKLIAGKMNEADILDQMFEEHVISKHKYRSTYFVLPAYMTTKTI